ncbi:MAG TPA: glycosyltransferase [Bacteroidia bacterium]|jgi:glycosyltransferase involved in cell wall biosynthesis|nr:glycosyltransferase [Bacteroidia bacterium]
MKKAIVSVINDLSTDQRVHKVCTSLHGMGYKVLLVGRRRRNSQELDARRYRTRRLFLLFEQGPLFYFFFQLRLFLFLLFHKAELLVSNDLDTLLPNYLASKLKRIPLVYDSHELFCEVPELQHHPIKKSIWKRLERFLFPKIKRVITVNESIAGIYQQEYGVPVRVVRNLPRKEFSGFKTKVLTRKDLDLPEDAKIILLQGAGINIDRGGEEALQAMQYVAGALLLIIGSGDVIGKLKQMTRELNLENKVRFIDKLPFPELKAYTLLADLGLTLDKDTNVNYRYSLPNKLFDYIHAGVPVCASDLVEVKKIVEQYGVGCISPNLDPIQLAGLWNKCLADTEQMDKWKANCIKAAAELCWETEEKVIREVYSSL